jgi:hypothetical protein
VHLFKEGLIYCSGGINIKRVRVYKDRAKGRRDKGEKEERDTQIKGLIYVSPIDKR